MRRVIAILAFVGFGLSLVVHVSTYQGNNYVGGIRVLGLLHIGAIINGSLLLGALRRNGWNWGEHTDLVDLPEQSQPYIRWLYFYAFANGLLSLITRTIVTMLSGCWLAIYLVAAVYFLNPSRRKLKENIRRSLSVEYYFYDRGIAEPKQKAQAPEQKLQVPEQMVQKPEKKAQAPEQIVQKPEQIVQKPEQKAQAPELGVVPVSRPRNSAGTRFPIRHGYEISSIAAVALVVAVVVGAYHGVYLYEEIPCLLLVHVGIILISLALQRSRAPHHFIMPIDIKTNKRRDKWTLK